MRFVLFFSGLIFATYRYAVVGLLSGRGYAFFLSSSPGALLLPPSSMRFYHKLPDLGLVIVPILMEKKTPC